MRSQRLFCSPLLRPYICINICATASIMTALEERSGPWNVLSAVWTPLGTDVSEHLFWTPKPIFPRVLWSPLEGRRRGSERRTCLSSRTSHRFFKASFGAATNGSCVSALGHSPVKMSSLTLLEEMLLCGAAVRDQAVGA